MLTFVYRYMLQLLCLISVTRKAEDQNQAYMYILERFLIFKIEISVKLNTNKVGEFKFY